MSENAIEFTKVQKRYGAVTAVDDISFGIRRGELVTFLGPSGCGKTTTLRLVAGLELPTAGQVLIAGKDVSKQPASERNVGMVFQSYALFPHMSVMDNVAYGPVIRGGNKAEAVARGREILSLLGLSGLEERLPSELSGGQQQRVAVARAIVQQPDVLLFDEPLSNVDAKLRRRVREEIRDLQRRFNLTAVYVTHDQEEALAVSDRIVVMSNGRIAQIGTPSDLYERPNSRFVADFIGDANLIEGTVEAGQGGPIFRADDAAMQLAGDATPGKATLSIRPERIALRAGEGQLQGTIETATYLGGRTEYRVGTPFGPLLVSAPATAPTHKVADRVAVEIAPDAPTIVEHERKQ
ncbi:ABC transporter ATP-binding protein [Mesorhizobium microcysteis]|uniref:ABC transporter ATP-binding protein n=1 Tax=Neoaquamicrobium microcysteis TaxID=2682781 RepID=A0A5D4GPI2_9HYPH|nr:ABC transporter ATP-binding protein [Mesorhizobium microcysteis]TYR30054.1 ABC transporter ATP-binding protein [Mesorhizobium microcysteis]